VNTEGKNRIAAALAELRDGARQDLAAAWGERLRAAFTGEIDRVLEARIAAMLPRIREAVQFEIGWSLAAEVDAAAPEIAARAAREAGERFNRAVRRLLESREGPRPLSDAARELADRVLLFSVADDTVVVEDGSVEVKASSAPAFQNAIEARETVIALRTAGELSAPIAALGTADRCYLFPVTVNDAVVAVVYAEGERVDVAAMEALTAVAGAVAAPVEEEAAHLEAEEEWDLSTQDRAPAAAAKAAASAGTPETWGNQPADLAPPAAPRTSVETVAGDAGDAGSAPPALSPDTLRARHFARIRVAEMLLYRHDAVRSGRESRDLYTRLRKEIDSARDVYASQFGFLEDYLHMELVQTLAKGDPGALGPDYPGPLR